MAEIEAWIGLGEAGFDRLWNPALGAYCSLDLRSGRFADGISAGTFLAFYAGVAERARADRLLDHHHRWAEATRFGVPSYDPAHAAFDPLRYWRGPIWAIVNWMIADGYARTDQQRLAAGLRADTRTLIEGAGFCEYFCPLTGRGCGGDTFSWTAAIWLAWASPSLG
jgi:glycogen debranching enzyme